MTDLRIPKTGGSESNPFRPDLPQDIRQISESLFAFMREQVGNLRRQHNATQGGDSTFSWELLTEPESTPQFTLGSLGRFFHHTYGLILARYVQFADMDHSGEWTGVPLGYHHSQAPFMWRVTNDLTKSRSDLAMGVAGPYVIPQDGQFGWMIVNGVNIQALLSSSIPVRFARFSWKQTSRVELVGEHSGPPIARLFGDQWIARGDGPWWIPPGQAYIDTLTLSEAASVGGFDSIGVEDQIQQLADLVANTRFTVDYQLDQSSVELQTAREGINLTAKMLQRRMASLGLDSIQQVMQETLQATITAKSLALTAADNSDAAVLITQANLVSTNDFKRTAEVSATDAGIFANSATEASNTATLNANESTIQAQAAATSASNAAVSETNAGTSATAASNSATSAATSAGTATTQAGIATTQAGNAATSAGNASTSASQASTSATNAAGSASSAASSATTATNAATTATTQAGNAATSASNASTYASNASTSATQASTSATNAGTSATNASNSATAANTSAVNAASSATAAAGSATTASTQAGAAATSASNAATSATAAGSSATSANTSATNASTSATTATTQAGIATTQAGNASTSASAASTSASSASGSATSASTSATAAANSATSAQQSANTGFPQNFIGQDKGFAAPGSGVTFPTVTGVGTVYHALGQALIYHVATRNVIAGSTLSIQARLRVIANTANYLLQYDVHNGTTLLGSVQLEYTNHAADSTWFNTLTYTISCDTILAAYPTATHVVPYLVLNYSIGVGNAAYVQECSDFIYLDTTAATKAAAAATSASTATTQASNAGTSATAASTSATNAATSASGASSSASTASTQASNAASSATAASGSASTASTQASNAATSASNAASSATSAATQATNASTSASSASSSATLAARLSQSNLVPNAWPDWTSTLPNLWDIRWPLTLVPVKTTSMYGGNAVRMVGAAGDDTYIGIHTTPVTITIPANGWFVMEADVTLNSGALTAAGLLFRPGGLDEGSLNNSIKFAVDPDNTGAVVGAGVAGKTYFFRKLFKNTLGAQTYFTTFIMSHYSAFGSTAVANDITFQRFGIRPATLQEAMVTTSSGVAVDLATRIATASFETVTVAGSATAALRINSKAIGGSASSSVAIEGEEIQLFSNALGVRALGLKMTSSGVLVTGDLDVGKGVKIGSRRIPVALQSFQVTAKDGDAVDFGTDLGNTPVLLFDTSHLAPKTAAQAYDVRATSLTASGFTMYAKITTPSSPTTNTMSTSNDAGAGVTPRYQIEKSVTPDAYDGNYTFSVQLTVTFTDNGDGSASGYAEYDCYVRSAGAWVFAGTISKNITKATPGGSFSRNVQGVVNFAGTIGQDAGGTKEFGIIVVAGLFTAFNSVTFLSTSTSGTSSASPSGELVTVTVIPQNV